MKCFDLRFKSESVFNVFLIEFHFENCDRQTGCGLTRDQPKIESFLIKRDLTLLPILTAFQSIPIGHFNLLYIWNKITKFNPLNLSLKNS